MAYINLFAFDISNSYDSALLKLEVLLTVNCLKKIFVCFYLFKDCASERAEEPFPSGDDACGDVAAGLESLGAAVCCQPAAIGDSHPNPQTCVRASSAFPKSYIPEITAIFPAFPKLGQV